MSGVSWLDVHMRAPFAHYYSVHSQSFAVWRGTTTEILINACSAISHARSLVQCVLAPFSFVRLNWIDRLLAAVCVDNLSVFLTVFTVKDKLKPNKFDCTTLHGYYMLHSIKNALISWQIAKSLWAVKIVIYYSGSELASRDSITFRLRRVWFNASGIKRRYVYMRVVLIK